MTKSHITNPAPWFDNPKLKLNYLTGGDMDCAHPSQISEEGEGGKFTPSGRVLNFPGNTFICHIDPASHAHAALTDLSKALNAGPTRNYFAFLPPSSFHMTVFPAICGDPLGHDGWPKDMAPGSSLSIFNQTYRTRFADTSCFERCSVKPTGTIAGTSVIVDGLSVRDCAALWDTRRTLQDLTGLYRPDFETYKFHISLCYQTRWMDDDTAWQHLTLALPLFETFKDDVTQIDLGSVEFCRFSDMFHFEAVT